MPRIFGRNIPPVVLGLGTILAGYLVYTTLFPADNAVVATTKPKAKPKQTTGETDYLPSDYKFVITSLPPTVVPKDAFRPLVYKSTISAGGVPSIDSYTYSGMAQLNDQSYGLLENTQTGQGDFVQPGQRWHEQWLVVKVSPDEIVVKNDSGDSTTLMAGAAAEKAAASVSTPAAGGNVPVNPMVGAIGPNDLSVTPDPNAPQGNNGNGRGRGRGRRGRSGGGYGGGMAAPAAGG